MWLRANALRSNNRTISLRVSCIIFIFLFLFHVFLFLKSNFPFDFFHKLKDATATDIKNASEGKETGMDKTRRLFYVICSRAKESLAIVAYADNPKKLKDNLTGKGWFTDDEIIFL